MPCRGTWRCAAAWRCQSARYVTRDSQEKLYKRRFRGRSLGVWCSLCGSWRGEGRLVGLVPEPRGEAEPWSQGPEPAPRALRRGTGLCPPLSSPGRFVSLQARPVTVSTASRPFHPLVKRGRLFVSPFRELHLPPPGASAAVYFSVENGRCYCTVFTVERIFFLAV